MDNGRSVPFAWAGWINFALGIWLIISPFALAGSGAAYGNNIVFGILIAIAGWWAAHTRATGPSWWNVIMGIWMIIAPFALGFVTGRNVANDVVVGILVIIFGLIAALGNAAYHAPGGGYTTASTRT